MNPRPPASTPYAVAQQSMLRALLHVRHLLPPIAQTAVHQAHEWAGSGIDGDAEEALRVALWDSIRGRDMNQEPEVLKIRAAICVLYAAAAEVPDGSDTLEYFENTFLAAGFPPTALAAPGSEA